MSGQLEEHFPLECITEPRTSLKNNFQRQNFRESSNRNAVLQCMLNTE